MCGLGSLFQQKRGGNAVGRVTIAVIGILTVSVLYLLFLDAFLSFFISYSVAVRFIITALLLAPVSFFMGWMFPIGMTLIERNAVNLVPWVWGVNGFASVSAAPLAVMLSMSFGFRAVIVMALVLYLTAGSMAGRLNKGIV